MNVSEAVAASTTATQALHLLGRRAYSADYSWLRQHIQNLDLDTSHWAEISAAHNRTRTSMSVDDLTENSPKGRISIRRFVLRHNLISYTCAVCHMPPIWNDKPLVLRLDHINGVPNDNRLENLQFVCPNCDSQLPTFAGRNSSRIRPANRCGLCDKVIVRKSKFCGKCSPKTRQQRTKIEWPPYDVLLQMMLSQSIVGVAKQLGVSDNAVRKRILRYEKARAYGIEIRHMSNKDTGCGTVAGYFKCGKVKCGPCKTAMSEYQKERRRKARTSK